MPPREGDVRRGANLNAEGWPGPWHHLPGTRVRGEDTGHGKAWRVDVRTVKGSDLWREERQANQVPRGQLQQESQRAIPEGICPINGQTRVDYPEGRRPPGDAGQHVGGEQGGSKAQGEPFNFAPCNTLGEEWAVHPPISFPRWGPNADSVGVPMSLSVPWFQCCPLHLRQKHILGRGDSGTVF